MQGRIIKGIGGFYSVMRTEGEIVTCKARGRFRNENLTPMVGDLAEISIPETGYASLDELLPRKNALLRPPVSNIDQLVIVISASVPKPDWLLADKLLLQAHTLRIAPLLLLNKIDAGDDAVVHAFQKRLRIVSYPARFLKDRRGAGCAAAALAGAGFLFRGTVAVGKSPLSMLSSLRSLWREAILRKKPRAAAYDAAGRTLAAAGWRGARYAGLFAF